MLTEHLRGDARLHQAEVLLQHRRGTLEGVHGLGELLLRRDEVTVLLAADARRGAQLLLRGRDLLGQIACEGPQILSRPI